MSQKKYLRVRPKQQIEAANCGEGRSIGFVWEVDVHKIKVSRMNWDK